MKRVISVLVVLVIALSLCACRQKKEELDLFTVFDEKYTADTLTQMFDGQIIRESAPDAEAYWFEVPFVWEGLEGFLSMRFDAQEELAAFSFNRDTMNNTVEAKETFEKGLALFPLIEKHFDVSISEDTSNGEGEYDPKYNRYNKRKSVRIKNSEYNYFMVSYLFSNEPGDESSAFISFQLTREIIKGY